MSKESQYQKGDVVKDKVHKVEGVVVDVVSAAEDGHHQTFYVVEYERETASGVKKFQAHLTEKDID